MCEVPSYAHCPCPNGYFPRCRKHPLPSERELQYRNDCKDISFSKSFNGILETILGFATLSSLQVNGTHWVRTDFVFPP